MHNLTLHLTHDRTKGYNKMPTQRTRKDEEIGISYYITVFKALINEVIREDRDYPERAKS